MNVARFNFSHDTHEGHLRRITMVREVSEATGIPVAILLDTKGPEIRTGINQSGEKIDLRVGQRVVVTTREVECTSGVISITYKQLPAEVSRGKHIFLADGLINLEVESVDRTDIHCVVRSGGQIGSRKNVNVRGVRTSLPAVTEKDVADIEFAVEHGLDFIAASFIRKPDDVTTILDILDKHRSPIQVIAKIEDREGLDNIDEIIRVSDGIMVARGDLGVQLPTEEIPLAQKRIIEKCNKRNKPVITATQMLDSMINNPFPTRAELTDVANAIFDGTDAVMLSGETASGKYPVATIETMHRIALSVETSDEYSKAMERDLDFLESNSDIGHAMAKAAFLVAHDIDAQAIVTPTLRGNTPRILSQFRPRQPIIAVTTSDVAHRQLLLHWGIFPVVTELVDDSESMVQNALLVAQKLGFVHRFDKVVTAAGVPVNSPIMMNTIKVHFLGNILARGHRGFGGSCTGKLVRASDINDARRRLDLDGSEILLTHMLTEAPQEIVSRIRGIVLEEQSQIPWETLQEHNPDLVFLSEVSDAMSRLENNLLVSLDGGELIVYEGMLDGTV